MLVTHSIRKTPLTEHGAQQNDTGGAKRFELEQQDGMDQQHAEGQDEHQLVKGALLTFARRFPPCPVFDRLPSRRLPRSSRRPAPAPQKPPGRLLFPA